MTKPRQSLAILLALAAGCLCVQAQTIYRCGDSYGNVPCANATVVASDDTRSAAQRAQTETAARRDASAAQLLAAERIKQESKPAPALVLAASHPATNAVATEKDQAAPLAKPKKPQFFTAVAPKKPGDAAAKKKKKKAAETA